MRARRRPTAFGDAIPITPLAQAEAARAGRIRYEALARAHLDRIARENAELSAFVSVFRRRALLAARALDRGLGDRGGVFRGVPCGIKDTDPVRWSFVRGGSRAYRYALSPVDGGAARRIRRSGALIVGKLATSELAILPVTEPDIHPPTRNPYSYAHTPGGSSGGSAAAVAAGLIPIAHASDGAGSIRIPSAFCHVYGFKPSRTHVPNFYARTEPNGLAATGVIARAVRDAAAMLDVLCGVSRPDSSPTSFLARCGEEPPRLRIGLCARSPLTATSPAIEAATRRVAERLERLGHALADAPPLDAGRPEEFLPLMQRSIAAAPVLSRASLQPLTRWMHEAGKRISKEEARARFRRLERRVREWGRDFDVLVTPTVAVPPPRVGALDADDPRETFRRAVPLGAFTAPFNVSGQPAASVPAGLDPDGLPIGVQIVGPPGGDLLVLQLSQELEREAPWAERFPPGYEPGG